MSDRLDLRKTQPQQKPQQQSIEELLNKALKRLGERVNIEMFRFSNAEIVPSIDKAFDYLKTKDIDEKKLVVLTDSNKDEIIKILKLNSLEPDKISEQFGFRYDEPSDVIFINENKHDLINKTNGKWLNDDLQLAKDYIVASVLAQNLNTISKATDNGIDNTKINKVVLNNYLAQDNPLHIGYAYCVGADFISQNSINSGFNQNGKNNISGHQTVNANSSSYLIPNKFIEVSKDGNFKSYDNNSNFGYGIELLFTKFPKLKFEYLESIKNKDYSDFKNRIDLLNKDLFDLLISKNSQNNLNHSLKILDIIYNL
jgi:hypothetical protein